jgi:hypothetical protein
MVSEKIVVPRHGGESMKNRENFRSAPTKKCEIIKISELIGVPHYFTICASLFLYAPYPLSFAKFLLCLKTF